MQLEAKHDYSAVEQALEQNEAPAKMRIMVGHGLRALAVGFALSVVILSCGFAWKMAMAEEPVANAPAKTPVLPKAPEQTGGENPVVRKYVIFESIDADMVREGLSISAGHNYTSSKQASYDDAFCYVSEMSNGAHTRIDLSIKLPGAIPTGVPGNGKELELTDADMAELRALCPYL